MEIHDGNAGGNMLRFIRLADALADYVLHTAPQAQASAPYQPMLSQQRVK